MNESSSSSDESSEPNLSNKKKIKINLSEDKKLKFNQLKDKRLKLTQKYERKTKKTNNTNNDSIAFKQEEQSIASNKSIIDTNLIESSINSIQHELDKAIESNNIDLADQLSDKLSNEQIKLNTIKQQIQQDYFNSNSNKIDKTSNSKLFWRFEAKKRWETKSNM